ncbi:trimeric intracellular cation channel family protein [Euzebya sp.]|uniref:trimeric intracellular cation channel family protein n=1 Tax=Euzebya sp. TaxID=1971409 RepID=UPI003512BE90
MDVGLADEPVQLALELAGVVVFAISGALLAIRKGFDVVGIAVLAVLTGLGGGLIRDVLIGDIPPAAFEDTRYLAAPLVTAAVVALVHRPLERIERAVLVFDAAGVGLFAVTGALKAVDAGLGPLQSVLMGVVTAVGGGMLRDVVAQEAPVVVRSDSTLYAVPATAGAAAVVAVAELQVFKPVIGIAIVVAVFAWRVAAMRFGWTAPTALGRRR